MSDPKRANIITVGAPKSVKKNVTKSVRLNINLDESNESKYPELNYKELVIKQDRKQKSTVTVENGKTGGLDPFSDNDEDVERVARKFEQKYGGNSTYGKKKSSKKDDFADIGAGYDENDSFIDNTDGYDEMIPPEIDTLYGGFYINSGSLEFKTVPENSGRDDSEPQAGRRNKRRISSSSGVESSDSSSESDSPDEKETQPVVNGDEAKTEHRRKRKNKAMNKLKKMKLTDSSAANSGKQTSDDNVHCDGESGDSRTSQSDSLTSKPAPSSENPITSDSSRDIMEKPDQPLPSAVRLILDDMKSCVPKSTISADHIDSCYHPFLIRLDKALLGCSKPEQKKSWTTVARLLNTTKNKLIHKLKSIKNNNAQQTTEAPLTTLAPAPTAPSTTKAPTNNKRKSQLDLSPEEISRMSAEEKEVVIVDALQRLKMIIAERQPSMIANYNTECERIQEERKKLQSQPPGAPVSEISKRLPKRRFPWCGRSRTILCTISKMAGANAHTVLLQRVLPLFPKGFVRMPTLLRQAEIKSNNLKRQANATQSNLPPLPALQPAPTVNSNTEHIQFPSSLTVTATTKISPEKTETKLNNSKQESLFGPNPFSFFKEEKVEITVDLNKKVDPYIPNNIGSLTITPVNNITKPENKDKPKEPLIRVKSPAALLKDSELHKKPDKKQKIPDRNPKDKISPLQVDTNFFKDKKEQASPTQNNKKVNEDNLPRPALVPVHHSPTFAKPDKRPPEKKKKEQSNLLIDPLDTEPVSVDDSSSDVELVEDKPETDGEVPFKDKARNMDVDHVDEMDSVMRGLREIANYHEPKFSSKSFGSVITNAKQATAKAQVRSDNKLLKPSEMKAVSRRKQYALKTLLVKNKPFLYPSVVDAEIIK